MLSIKLYQCAETKYKVKNGGQIAIQEERLITGGGNPADQANLEVATLITKKRRRGGNPADHGGVNI